MSDALVKRYDVYSKAGYSVEVEECAVGEFVYYADYVSRIEALEAELKSVRRENGLMRDFTRGAANNALNALKSWGA